MFAFKIREMQINKKSTEIQYRTYKVDKKNKNLQYILFAKLWVNTLIPATCNANCHNTS